MAFFEQRIDSRIERGARGTLRNGGRLKAYNAAGKLRQSFGWSAQCKVFDVTHGLRSLADYETLRALWYVVMFTPYEGFRFRDWGDYIATQANTVVTALGGGSYQLKRRYTFGGINFDRTISKPNADAVLFDAGGSPLTATISTTTGIATSVSGTPATWTGTFDVPVTFLDNDFPEVLEVADGGPVVLTQPIKLEEVKL